MSKVINREPCPRCRSNGADGTGDNLAVYHDHKYCFACEYYEKVLDNNPDFCYNTDVEGEGTTSFTAWGQPQGTQDDGALATNTPPPWDDRYRYKDYKSFAYHPRFPRNTQYPGRDAMGGGGAMLKEDEIINYTYQYVPHRGLTRETLEFYDVQTKVDDQGTPVTTAFPYDGGKGLKVRDMTEKKFYSIGDMADASLFGQDKFPAGSSKSITITEGEYDCLSVYQMLGSKYPCVSIRGAASARRDVQRSFEYLNSFATIYICTDADAPGQRATAELASVFNPNKVRHVKLEKYKDANEYLQNGAEKEFISAWWAAKPYLPKGIVGDWASIEEIVKKEDNQAIASYPFATLQSMAYGIRPGELLLVTAQEKVGKTEVMRAIEYHILKETDLNIGIIHLEESEKRSVQGLASYRLLTPTHLPDSGVSTSDIITAYRELTRKDGRCFHYTHFGSDNPDTLLDILRYLVTVCSCRIIFLDHMTRLVTTQQESDERRLLDYLATRFAQMVVDLNFTLFVVSHVNDDGKPRGSRMIAKECNLHIFLSRDKENADAGIRNSVAVTLRDNRFGGITGPAGYLVFDPKTFTIKEKEASSADSR